MAYARTSAGPAGRPGACISQLGASSAAKLPYLAISFLEIAHWSILLRGIEGHGEEGREEGGRKGGREGGRDGGTEGRRKEGGREAKSDGLGGRDYGGDPAQDLILSTQRIPRGWDPILSTQRIPRGGDRILYTQRIVDNAYIEGRCDRKSPFSREETAFAGRKNVMSFGSRHFTWFERCEVSHCTGQRDPCNG